MRRGFTLVELLVAVVIVATLAAIAIPSYTKTRAKVNQRQAEAYLRVIRVAQKMYYARFGQYCDAAYCGNASAIKTNLGTEIKDGAYVFTSAAPTPTTFTATATGASTITLNQTGDFTKDGSPYTPT